MCGRPAYGYGDADKYGRVVGICWDWLGPVRLAKLVRSRVGSNLRKNQLNLEIISPNYSYICGTYTKLTYSGTRYIY